MTLVYARYDHFDEKRAMATTLERELGRILGTGTAKVRTARRKRTSEAKAHVAPERTH